ncbi:MAG: hypothetical protein H6850_00005 [Alphaproteobacteria bacterium]|nr:MAG: hypothetical protein H6850_00005 [Alphaproteobacteria bacterium]
MTLQTYLEENNLTNLYEQTKEIYKNFWNVVENNESFFKYIHLDLMEICNPIENLEERLIALESLENSDILLNEYLNVAFAFFNSQIQANIFAYKNLLPLFNQFELPILKAMNISDEFLAKLDDSFQNARITDYQIIRLFQNTYLAKTNSLCEKFFTFLVKLTPVEFAKHIKFFTKYDGFLLKTLEENFEIPDGYYLRFTKHHTIDMEDKDPAIFLLDTLYNKEWKQEVISGFFNPFNENILLTIDQLKIIEFTHASYDTIITSLFNLIYQDAVNGYKRAKLLLNFFLETKPFSPFLDQLKNFTQEEIHFIFLKLSEKLTLPSNFLKLPPNISTKFLKHLMGEDENLFWVLEEHNAFSIFFNNKGVLYSDLIHSLKNSKPETIEAWIKIFNTYPTIYNNFTLLSSLDESGTGYPNLISGMLSIGYHEEPSAIPNPENIQKFFDEILIDIDGQKMMKNIGTAIESLGSPIKAKKFVSYIKDKTDLINNISFDQDVSEGLAKAQKIVKLLVPSESTIMKKIAKNFFNQPNITQTIDKLFYQDIKGYTQIAEGFLKSVEKNSSDETAALDIQSFMCKDSEDPFRFVRMLERISGASLALDKFNTWFADSLQAREELIEKMCSMGDQLETFISNFAEDSQVGDIFQSLKTIKGKSSKLHDGLLTLFSRIPTDEFQELQPLIEERAKKTIMHTDVLHAVNSTEIDYERAKLFLTSLSPNLIDALHEAFEGEDDLDQTLKFITNILNKEFVIEALNTLTTFEAKLLIRTFAKNDIFMNHALQTINEFGFEGSINKVKTLIKAFIFIEPKPVNQKKGVDPLPIKTCEEFVHISADITDKAIWDALAEPKSILAIEKILTTQQNKKIAKTLLKDQSFLFVLGLTTRKEELLKYLAHVYQDEENFDLHPIYIAHLVLFDDIGIQLEEIFRYINEDLMLQTTLGQFIDPRFDPASKLLTCAIKTLYNKGYKDLEILLKILNQNTGMKDALCRLCYWKKNSASSLLSLLKWIKVKFIVGNDKFRFPKEENIVIQDDYLAQWLDIAKKAY